MNVDPFDNEDEVLEQSIKSAKNRGRLPNEDVSLQDASPATSNMSRIFTFLLILHVFLIGSVFIYNLVAGAPTREQQNHEALLSESGNKNPSSNAESNVETTDQTASVMTEVSYMVRQGDSIQSIAQSAGTTIDQIIQSNHLNAQGDLYVGRILKVMAKEDAAIHGVLAEIAAEKAKEATPVKEAPKAEAVAQASKVESMPKSTVVAESAKPVADAKPAAEEAVKPKAAEPKVQTYTVKKGDTFYGIAKKLNVNANDLMKANSVKDPSKLRIGMVLTIPSK